MVQSPALKPEAKEMTLTCRPCTASSSSMNTELASLTMTCSMSPAAASALIACAEPDRRLPYSSAADQPQVWKESGAEGWLATVHSDPHKASTFEETQRIPCNQRRYRVATGAPQRRCAPARFPMQSAQSAPQRARRPHRRRTPPLLPASRRP